MSLKYTIDHMHLLAMKRDGRCLSASYAGNKTPLHWMCSKGHTWFAKPNSIMSKNNWCPYCAGKAPKTLAYLQYLATCNGGQCLEETAHGMQNLHHWRCQDGHEFAMKPNNVKYGHWCPVCAQARRTKARRARAIRERTQGSVTRRAGVALSASTSA